MSTKVAPMNGYLRVLIVKAMKVDDAMYGRMVGMQQMGATLDLIAEKLKLSRRTVSYNLAAGRPSSRKRKKSKKSPATTQKLLRRRALVKQILTKRVKKQEQLEPSLTLAGRARKNARVPRVQYRHPGGSLRRCRRELASVHQINVSTSTVRRDRIALNLKCKLRGKGPERRLHDEPNRLKWAKKNLRFARAHKHEVVFIDEKLFDSLDCDRYAYVKEGETPPPREVERFPPRVHVVAFIGTGCKALHVFTSPSNVGAPEYREQFLKPNLGKFRNKYVLHDGCGAHRAVEDWLEKQMQRAGILGLVKIPARSPDANLIERMWSIVQQKVSAMGPLTEKELRVFVQRAFDEIPQAVVDRLCASWPRQLEAIIKAAGASTSKPLAH